MTTLAIPAHVQAQLDQTFDEALVDYKVRTAAVPLPGMIFLDRVVRTTLHHEMVAAVHWHRCSQLKSPLKEFVLADVLKGLDLSDEYAKPANAKNAKADRATKKPFSKQASRPRKSKGARHV